MVEVSPELKQGHQGRDLRSQAEARAMAGSSVLQGEQILADLFCKEREAAPNHFISKHKQPENKIAEGMRFWLHHEHQLPQGSIGVVERLCSSPLLFFKLNGSCWNKLVHKSVHKRVHKCLTKLGSHIGATDKQATGGHRGHRSFTACPRKSKPRPNLCCKWVHVDISAKKKTQMGCHIGPCPLPARADRKVHAATNSSARWSCPYYIICGTVLHVLLSIQVCAPVLKLTQKHLCDSV